MSELYFKRLEIRDVFTPERVAVFERVREDSDIVRIAVGGEFYCDAGTLRIAAEVLQTGNLPDSLVKPK
jgi:hypothetical protein